MSNTGNPPDAKRAIATGLGSNAFYELERYPPNRQRRSQNALPDEQIKALLRRGLVAHIATRWDEQPFVTPTSYLYDEAAHAVVFHSNVVGRLRANSERHTQVSLGASEFGNFLPSNDPLEVSVQYRSVVAFGTIRVLKAEEARRALYALLQKYFPDMHAGREYREITEADLKRTSVYTISIEGWSGKENWAARAEQTVEHPLLDERWFTFTNFLEWQKAW